MKLAITQILLAALVAASSIFTAAWYFPALIPPISTETASEHTREYVPAITTYYEEHWLIIFGWIAVLILLGLAVLGCGIAQLQKPKAGNNEFRLAITQTVLGVFIAAASLVTAVWYEPILTTEPYTVAGRRALLDVVCRVSSCLPGLEYGLIPHRSRRL